jgi:hypothetical protein
MGKLILDNNLVNVITQENTILGLLYCNNNITNGFSWYRKEERGG